MGPPPPVSKLTHRLDETIPAEEANVLPARDGGLAKSTRPRRPMIEVAYGSCCEIWKSPCGGFEHDSYMASDIGPSPPVPYHRAAEVLYAGWPSHCQIMAGSRARERSSGVRGDGGRRRQGKMSRLHPRIRSGNPRNQRQPYSCWNGESSRRFRFCRRNGGWSPN